MSARPQLRTYNEVSLDGRITGFVGGDGDRYYRRGLRHHDDAILMGSVTALNFGQPERESDWDRELPPLPPAPIPEGLAELLYEPRPLLVVPDSKGRVRCWRDALAQPWYRGAVAAVTESTPAEYLEHLARRGVGIIVAGTEQVDLVELMRVLADDYGVASVRSDSGGALNGALLQAGLVDEVGVYLVPSLVGSDRRPSVVTFPKPGQAIGLTLRECEQLDDGSVWLLYETA